MSKTILDKLNKIRSKIKVDKEGARYKAFTIAKLNAELNPLLNEYRLGINFNVLDFNVIPLEKDAGKYIFLVNGKIEYSITDIESGEVMKSVTGFTGLNSEGDPSKSQGNAHSYSYKYLWVTLLGLTDEESDVDSPIAQNNAMLAEQMESSSAKPLNMNESKALLSGYEEGFKICKDIDQVKELIEEAREDFVKMRTYEKEKLKKIISTIKEEWNI